MGLVQHLLHPGPRRRRAGQVWPGFEPARVVEMLEAAGLADATCRPLPPEPGATGPALVLCRAEKGG